MEDAVAGAEAARAAGMDCLGIGPALDARSGLVIACLPSLSEAFVNATAEGITVTAHRW